MKAVGCVARSIDEGKVSWWFHALSLGLRQPPTVHSLSIKTRKQGTYCVQVRYAGSSTLKPGTSSGRKIVPKQGIDSLPTSAFL